MRACHNLDLGYARTGRFALSLANKARSVEWEAIDPLGNLMMQIDCAGNMEI